MINENFLVYEELDPAKKNEDWMTNCVTIFRRSSRRIVNSQRMRNNKSLLLSTYDMEKIKAGFKDKEFKKNTVFEPIGVWSKIINILIEELMKNPPRIMISASDPDSINDKETDIFKLKNRKKIEKVINTARQKTKQYAPYQYGYNNFKGNVKEFDQLSLDDNDPDDVNFYSTVYQRMLYEIAGQNLLNEIFAYNRFDKDTLRQLVLDILAALVSCMQVYVDKVTGEIKYKHLYPEECFGVFGDLEDGSDDVCKGWERSVSVREFLAHVGNDFDWSRDWTKILWALNYSNGWKYTGFIRNNVTYDCWGNTDRMAQAGFGSGSGVQESALIDWNLAYNFRVYLGYIEFSTMEATATYLAKVGSGEIINEKVPFGLPLSKKEMTEYYKESWYNEQMYNSYYLATGVTSQWIFNWGKVYYQHLYGAYDQYAYGTLIYYRLEGKSAAEISIPYIDFINMAFYRMKWIVYHAKPRDEEYWIPELLKLAKSYKKLYPQDSNNTIPSVDKILEQIIEYQRANFVRLRDFPEVEGKPYPMTMRTEGNQNGIDPLAVGFEALLDWGERQISDKIGLNDIRLANIQNAREGYKQNLEETKASQNSTGYIYRMVQFTKEKLASMTLNYTQDIIRFKDSLPYKWLLKLIGNDDFENLKILGDYASHRYALFVNDTDMQFYKQTILQAAMMALDKGDGAGGLSVAELGLLLRELDSNPYKATALLDFMKRKAEKKQQNNAMQLEQQRHNNVMQEIQANAENDKAKIEGDIEAANVSAKGQAYVADSTNQTKIILQREKQAFEPEKQSARDEAQKDLATHKAALEDQAAFAT